jgi:hypothetical protein
LAFYRFHVQDVSGFFEDDEGIDLPDLHAALSEALRSAREVLDELPSEAGMQFVIADEAGRVVLMVPIQDMPREAKR